MTAKKISKKAKYLRYISAASLLNIVLLFLFAYAAIALLFSFVYWKFDLLMDSSSFPSALYFSFITQSTIGYGDIQPVGFGRMIVTIQSLIALVYYPIGTGLVLLKLLSPQGQNIEFDKNCVYNPKLNRFEFRYYNQHSLNLNDVKVVCSIRRSVPAENGNFRLIRNKVMLTVDTFPTITPVFPFITSTLASSSSNDDINDLPHGPLTLKPNHIDENCSLQVAITGSTIFGSSTSIHEYASKNILCGVHKRVMKNARKHWKSDLDWSNWGEVELSTPTNCHTCHERKCCDLTNNL